MLPGPVNNLNFIFGKKLSGEAVLLENSLCISLFNGWKRQIVSEDTCIEAL